MNGYRERQDLPRSAVELEKAQAEIRYVVKRAATEGTPWLVVDAIITKIVDKYVGQINDVDGLKEKARNSLAGYATVQYRIMKKNLAGLNLTILPAVALATAEGTPRAKRIKAEQEVAARVTTLKFNETVYVETAQPMGTYMKTYIEKVRKTYADLATSEAKDSYSDRVSLRNIAEMTERYNDKQKEISKLIDDGVNLVWISTHANCSERCQPWQGKLYSLDGSSGEVDGRKYQPLSNATDVYVTTKAGKTYKNGCISGFNCRHTLTPYKKGNKPIEVSASTVSKYREINDTQRAMERDVREKKALSIGLKGVDDKAARAYAKQARERYDEYMKYSKDNRVAFYPDRCKVFDGEELITPRYKRILDLYKAKI